MKLTVRLHVDGVHLAAQFSQQLRHDHAAGAATTVEGHTKATGTDAFNVEVRQGQHLIDVSLYRIGVVHDLTKRVPGRPRNAAIHQRAHFLAFIGREKKSRRADEFERVPLDGVVAGRNAEATGRMVMLDGQLDGGGGCHADIDHGAADRLQRAMDDAREHRSGHPTVTSHDNGAPSVACRPCAEGRGEGRHDFRGQPVADTSTYTGHTHHQPFECHRVPL